MQFVMNRNRTVGGIYGHFIRFEKNVPIEVPRVMWDAVQAEGAVPVSELPEEEVKASVFPMGADREKAFFDAFTTIIERNERGDFTASGLPNSKVIEKMLGFQVVNKERDSHWAKYMEESAKENDS